MADEHLHTARRRVREALCRDPLFWLLLAVTALAGIRALNDGIALAYDAETAAWKMQSAALSLLPGCVKNAGDLPFAAVVAVLVLVMAGRHALGKSARTAFLFLASFLAGIAGIVLLMTLGCGGGDEQSILLSLGRNPFPMGLAFGLYFWAGSVSLVSAFERRWYRMVPCFLVALGGTSAALFALAPALTTALVLVFELLLLAYGFTYACIKLKGSGNFRLLAVIGIALTLGGLLVPVFLPDQALADRLVPFLTGKFVTDVFGECRRTMDAVSIKMWLSNLWLGTGLGSFPDAFRFSVEEADWQTLPKTVTSASCGWLLLLSERGLAGVLMFFLPFAFLFGWYLFRVIRWVPVRVLPEPSCWLGLAVSLLGASMGIFDCSVLRTDVMMAMGALLAVSAASLPQKRDTDNG